MLPSNLRMKLSWRGGRLKGEGSLLMAAAAPRRLCAVRLAGDHHGGLLATTPHSPRAALDSHLCGSPFRSTGYWRRDRMDPALALVLDSLGLGSHLVCRCGRRMDHQSVSRPPNQRLKLTPRRAVVLNCSV